MSDKKIMEDDDSVKEMQDDDKKYKLECLMSDIRRVEFAKANTPELYDEAIRKLKGEAKVIMSLEELRAKGKKLAEKEAGYDGND
jgi:hypothetical protein